MTEFVKRLDDIVREELSFLGYEYNAIVAGLEASRSSGEAIVRMRPPYDDVAIEPPEHGVSDASFSARVRRRLREAIDAPERTPPPPGSV
ncbi:MAG TPA: hypothetical protein VIL97_02585 [Thermoanaerobaculia bacterium]